MTRGDIVIAAERGDFTAKPRPYVIVQSALWLADAAAVTLCPLTTRLTGADLIRVVVPATAATGLERASEIEVDRITTLRRARIRARIGQLPDPLIYRLDAALRRWLEL